MKISRGPNRLELRSGGGWLTLLGLPFLLGGGLLLLAPAAPLPLGRAVPEAAGLVVGLALCLMGSILVLGRSVVALDRASNRVTRWWGLLVPFRSTERALDLFTDVVLSRELSQAGNTTFIAYPVWLAGQDERLGCGSMRSLLEARRLSEEIAKFIGRDLWDETSGERVLRPLASLDESFRDRLRRIGEKVERPGMLPESSRIEWNEGFEGLVVLLPRSGLGTQKLFAALGAVAFAVMTLFSFLLPLVRKGVDRELPVKDEWIALLGLLAFIILPIVFSVLPAIIAAASREKIIASSVSLAVERKGLFGVRRREIRAEELEQLEIVLGREPSRSGEPGRVISARGDRLDVEFGSGLSSEELEWLHRAVCYYVTA